MSDTLLQPTIVQPVRSLPRIRSAHVLNILRLLLAAFLFTLLTRTSADPDLWGHLRFGRDIVRLKGVPSHDTYSFTSDIPWINHEWLAEVLEYTSYALGGPVLLVALKAALLLAMLWGVLKALRGMRDDAVVHDLLVFLVIAGTYGRSSTFRPQIFSLALFPALLSSLLAVEAGKPRALMLVPLIFVLWANLHGGWIVGLGAFGLWGAWAFLRADQLSLKRQWVLAAGVASVLATLVNPYGMHLWHFLGTTVRFSRDISDWQPLWKLPWVVLLPWTSMTLLAAAGAWFGRRSVNPAHVAIVALYWVSSLRVSRLDAFFILSAVILLGSHIRTAFRRFSRRRTPSATDFVSGPPRTFVAILLIGCLGIAASFRNFACIPVREDWMPEPASVAFIRSNRLQGRMLTFFDWGEYAIWHLAPAVKVSMDGRRETVYSDAMVSDHFELYRDAPESLDFVTRLDPDYAWLPQKFTVLKTLERAGWRRIYSGPKSAILIEPGGSLPARPLAMPSGGSARCFPGP